MGVTIPILQITLKSHKTSLDYVSTFKSRTTWQDFIVFLSFFTDTTILKEPNCLQLFSWRYQSYIRPYMKLLTQRLSTDRPYQKNQQSTFLNFLTYIKHLNHIFSGCELVGEKKINAMLFLGILLNCMHLWYGQSSDLIPNAIKQA